MSFAQGLLAGERMAAGWMEAYESADEKRRKKAAQEEIAKIGKSEPMPEIAPTYSAEQPEVGLNPQQSIMRQPPAEQLGSGGYGMGDDYASVPGMRTGLQASRAPAAAPAPVGAGFARGYTPQQIDNARGTGLPMPMSARTAQEADIYAKYGLSDQATRSRERAYEIGRQEVADANTAEANQRVTDEYNYKLKQRQGNETAIKALSERLAAGELLDVPSIYAISSEAGADPQAMTAFVGDSLGISEKVAVAKVNKMARDVEEAAKDPQTLNAYIQKNADPDPNDGITPELRQVQGGWVIMYGDKPLKGTQLYPDTKDMPGFTALAYDMVQKAKGNPLAWVVQKQAMEKTAAAIEASKSTTAVNQSTIGLNNARAGQIRQMNDALATNLKNSTDAKAIQAEFAALDDTNDPGGAKRQSLITQFNMLSVKAGGTIPVGGGAKKGSVLQTPVELKKNDDGTYTAFAKDGGQALYNTFNGETIPLGMDVDTYRGMKEAAKKNAVGLVAGEDNGRLVIKFTGADGKFYDDAEKAKYAKPAKSAAQPGGLDTSRTPVVQPAAEPTAPTPKPEKRSGETQTAFRERLIAWDNNRMAYERLMTEQRLKGQLSGNAAGLRRPLVD
jgi:hypothetical protein